MVMYIVPGPLTGLPPKRIWEDDDAIAQRFARQSESFHRSPTGFGQPHPMSGTSIRPSHPASTYNEASSLSVQPKPEDRWEKERWEVFVGSSRRLL
jgi:hypothetical protein